MFEKNADTATAINRLLARRWSGRAYDRDRGVARNDLVALAEAARWAPSCYGDQPWRFLFWDRNRDEGAWRRAFECLGELNQRWAERAPVLAAVCSDQRFTSNDKPNRWGAYDSGAAAMSLCVQATELGLMVHQMGGFDAERLRAAFSIPDRYAPMAMMTIGYQVDQGAVPADLAGRELAPRQRRPLDESFFDGGWGIPLRR
ncbi:MAG: nitroreductase family protein [Gammaproteobacteria bacterium]|nr:nitroreductase family protein [Gammaproteobacteria bacterium]